MRRLAFPDGRQFAFTIMDDTDVATVANVGPIYRLLSDIGMRTTKTVCPQQPSVDPERLVHARAVQNQVHVEVGGYRAVGREDRMFRNAGHCAGHSWSEA